MVLGDDIIIWNESVAKSYHSLMTVDLGVKISLPKSLISHNGVFEFAKRLIDPFVGPFQAVPLKEFSLASKNLSALEILFKEFRITPSANQVLRVLGFGYKVLGSLTTKLRESSRAG